MKKTNVLVAIMLVGFLCSMMFNPVYANADTKASGPFFETAKVNTEALLLDPTTGQDAILGMPDMTVDQNIITSVENGSAPDALASSGNSLPEKGKDIKSIESMGFDTSQPARIAPDGSEVDKNRNPFGSKLTTFSSNTSLVAAGIPAGAAISGGGNFYIADGNPGVNGYKLNYLADNTGLGDWTSNYPKVMTAADIDGSGYDKVLAAVLIPMYNGRSITSYGLGLEILSYENGNVKKQYVSLIDSGINMPGLPANSLDKNGLFLNSPTTEEYRTHLKVAVCKDKLAVLVNKDLYEYKITNNNGSFSFSLLGITNLTNIADAMPIMDMKAYDVNDDGLKELLVTVGSTSPEGAELRIYDWESKSGTINNPVSISISSMRYASVTVGNVTGEGQSIVVGGYGKDDYNLGVLCYINYNQKTHAYEKSNDYNLDEATLTLDDNKRNCLLPSLECVSFQVPNAGEPQYIVFGNDLYKVDGSHIKYENNISQKNIENVTKNLIHLDTMVGHFLSDTPVNQQQMVILEEDRDRNYETIMIYMNSSGQIEYQVMESFKGSLSELLNTPLLTMQEKLTYPYNGYYPALCGASVNGEHFTLKYLDALFTMSDPKVVAVLGASPYYKELQDKYGNGWGNGSTDFGTGKSKETELEHEVNFSIGATFGTDIEVSAGLIVQQKLFEFEFGVNLTACFTKAWSESTSIEVSKSFSAMNNDMVVVTSVPYDVYRYQVIDPGQPDDGSIKCLYVPYTPQFSEMNLNIYNEMAQQINHDSGINAVPTVDKAVLNHTVGDPRSYSSSSGFSGAMTGDGFIGVGIGDGVSQQGISKTSIRTDSFSTDNEVETSFTLTVGSFVLGANQGAGYSDGMSTSVSVSEDFSGSVVNLPEEYKEYNFSWQFIAYKYPLAYGDGSYSQCYVLNYLVKPNSTVPPKPPENIRLVKYSGDSAEITWDKVNGASKYYVYRSTSEDIDTSTPYKTISNSEDSNTFATLTDTGLTPYRQYYYAVASATDGLTGIPSSTFVVPLKLKGIEIKTQPKLEYMEGDALDLSLLDISLILSDASAIDMGYNDFFKRGITVSINDGEALMPEYNGYSLVIFDPISGLSGVTEPLKISASVSKESGLYVETYFTVGSVEHAANLIANNLLVSHTAIRNNESTAQSVIVVTAQYEGNDMMVQMDYKTRTISPGESITLDAGNFILPANIANCRVKVFVLEGSSFQNSSMRPVANPVEIR